MAISASAQASVAASVQQTFALLTDPQRFHEWQSGMAVAQTDSGPIKVGSRLRSKRTIAGMTVPFSSEVTQWEPPVRMVFRSVRTPLRVSGEYRVTDGAQGSRVTATLEIAAPRWGPLRLGVRAEQMIADQLQRDLDAFAAMVAATVSQATDRPKEHGIQPDA